MSPARVLAIIAVFFMAGVALYSGLGFSWWLMGIFISGLVFFGISGVIAPSEKIFISFLIFLAIFLGLVRASTFSSGDDASETTFWNGARGNLVTKIENILPQPESGVFSAMVLGFEDDISAELKNAFNVTGTRHILAISGMNITIISGMLMSLGLFFGLWRRQAFWLAIIGIIIFILLVGSPASAVRAGLMGGLALWAKNQGRLVLAWQPVVVAAFLMVFLKPTLLVFDIGFQLSFLAVIGLIFFNNFWLRIFNFVPIKIVRELLALSMAVQVTTWPITLYNFGTFSAISPIANIFVVPLLTPIMFLGLGFTAVFWSNILAQAFLWPAWLILKVDLYLVNFFAAIPWANLNLGKIGLVAVILYYPALVWFWKFLEKHKLNDAIA